MNRKEFIAATSTIFASTFISDSFAAANKLKLKKGISYYMIKEELSVLDKFKLVKDLGFHGIEINSPGG